MEKVSSTKPVPGAKNVRDRCVKWLWPGYEGELSEARSKGLRDWQHGGKRDDGSLRLGTGRQSKPLISGEGSVYSRWYSNPWHPTRGVEWVHNRPSLWKNRSGSGTGRDPEEGSVQSSPQSCPALCNPVNCSTPDLPVHHQLPEFTQTHVHQVGDAIQPSHRLSSPSPPAPSSSQHQSLFQWVNSLHEVAKVLEFQLEHTLYYTILSHFSRVRLCMTP